MHPHSVPITSQSQQTEQTGVKPYNCYKYSQQCPFPHSTHNAISMCSIVLSATTDLYCYQRAFSGPAWNCLPLDQCPLQLMEVKRDESFQQAG